jgi:hypothetical protein
MKKLQRFLYSNRPDHRKSGDNNNTVTNVTSLSGTWGGKWFIPDDKYQQFLTLYFEAITEGEILRLVEKKAHNK